MLGWDRYGFHKTCARTPYAELVFFHQVGYTGYIVHFGASGAQNIDTLFFMLMWDRYGFDKKCSGTRYAELMFLHPVAPVGHIVHSGASRP
jgi:hypothetical protein